MMNVWKYEKISDKFVRSCMKLLNVPIRITFYTLLGRVLVFLGDKFCQYSLDLEGIGWMRSSLLLWSVGVWFTMHQIDMLGFIYLDIYHLKNIVNGSRVD